MSAAIDQLKELLFQLGDAEEDPAQKQVILSVGTVAVDLLAEVLDVGARIASALEMLAKQGEPQIVVTQTPRREPKPLSTAEFHERRAAERAAARAATPQPEPLAPHARRAARAATKAAQGAPWQAEAPQAAREGGLEPADPGKAVD